MTKLGRAVNIINIVMGIGWIAFLVYDWRLALLTSCGTTTLVLIAVLARYWYVKHRHFKVWRF